MRLVLAALLTLVTSCSPPSAGPANSAGDDDGEQDAPRDESPRDRQIREAVARREECNALADTVGTVGKSGRHIVNVNDNDKMRRLAGEHQDAAKIVGQLELTLGDLRNGRDKYAKSHLAMARALVETADSQNPEARRAAYKHYVELNANMDDIVVELNQLCGNAPMEADAGVDSAGK
jgi:hypothetical protein